MSRADLSASRDPSPAGVRVPVVDNRSEVSRIAENADPQRLIAVLIGCGWEIAGRRSGVYVRLCSSADAHQRDPSVLVPLNRTAGDFGLLMEAAVETVIDSSPETWRRSIEPLLRLTATDTFDFRKETSAPRRLIAWNDGSKLIDSARRILIAGAKAHREPSRHFSKRRLFGFCWEVGLVGWLGMVVWWPLF